MLRQLPSVCSPWPWTWGGGVTVAPTPQRSARGLRLAGPAVRVAAAVAFLVWGLAFGGGAAPLVLGDPGPMIRWGLPVATLAVNLTAAVMVGSLVLALYALPAGERAFDAALDTASASAALFTVAAARSEEHTSELQSLMRISYAVFCLKKTKKHTL